ncbi:hypothetical protein M406DRAFT_353492 [Cryphonectria parasitica EP155]|uniref:Uncharacterized protein n=1 Tax=Cryphonectria parasitica (strain ATCC 38755 / EP155) TaxID=660469 RepID=A0A9P4XTF2_CRYP1|nr:uncharacterized protein M406DRAFT_353492 [Cryphonectria parasitica EP155]KAF3760679.1 hypothetical protein M406DRAFT_353492 [Cryphonectria parasitica EP155]
MATASGAGDDDTGRRDVAASEDMNLRQDPPPRPVTTYDTPEEEDEIEDQVVAWVERSENSAYLRSWDPRPLRQMPLLSSFWGYDEDWYRNKLWNEALHVTRVAGRRLTPEELSLFTFHVSKGVVAASYDRPFALGVTAFLLWRGAATFRMPFYQPKFVRFAHPQMTRLPFLTSMAWHGTRIGAYGAVAYVAFGLLSQRYQTYMMNTFGDAGLEHELGLKKLVEDTQDNLQRLEREAERRRRLGGQIDE